MFRSSSLRVGLALARTALLYILFCWTVMFIGLEMRSAREHGWGLNPGKTPLEVARSETLPPQTTAQDSARQANNAHFGLPFIGTTVELDALPEPERVLTLKRLSDHGVGWIRQRFDWNLIEPKPGEYDWRSYDAVMQAINESNLTAIAVLDGSPTWARQPQDRLPTDNPLAPPSDPRTFARFATAFAKRYGDDVRYYQIWDEPNIAPHWGNQHITPTEYAQLLIEASQAIRAVDEDAVIIAGALAPTRDRGHTAIDEVFFLQRMYAAGVKPHVDMISIEPFGFGYSAEDPAQRPAVLNFQRAALVRRAMIAAGDGTTPLLAARFGWNQRPASPWRTVDPAEQQAFLDDGLDIAWRLWPWLAGLGWAIDQPAAPAGDPIWGFALNESLLQTIGDWNLNAAHSRTGYAIETPWNLMLLSVTLAVVLWRMGAALRLLPYPRWRTAYVRARPAVKMLLWLTLVVLYFFATWPPLILLLLILASALIAIQPSVGLWLAAALLPFHFQHKEIYIVDQTLFLPPAQAALLASLPAIVGQFRHNLRRHHRSILLQNLQPLDWYGIAWLGLSLLTMLNVWFWPGYRAGMLELVIVPLALYSMVRLFATDQRTQTFTAAALLGGGILVVAAGLVGWAAGAGTNVDAVRRLVGPTFSPNHAALYLERTLFLGMGFHLYLKCHEGTGIGSRSRRRRAYLLASTIGIALALLLTASRGALLLGVPFGTIVFSWLVYSTQITQPNMDVRANDGNRALRLLTGGAVAGLILSVPLVVAFWPRLSNTATILERMGVWRASLALWLSSPVLGAGPGGFYWRFPATIPIGSSLDPNLLHPHSIWLESTTMWGGIGLIWLAAMIGWTMRQIQKERKTLRVASQRGIVIGLLAGLAAGIAHGQVDAFGALADIAAWNWLALALWRAMVRGR